MATAEEILAQAIGDTVDANVLVIDGDLRTIMIPKGVTNLGVESDDEVLVVKFKMPSTYCGIDLSTFKVRINYLNAKAEGDMYEVTDLQKVDDYMTFSWIVGRHATLYKGNVKFNVCLKEVDNAGNVTREFNTTIATLPVLEGLEVGEQAIAEYTDIFEQWREMLFGTGDTVEADINALAEAKKQEINTLADSERITIEDTGRRVLNSIPDAYTDLNDKVDETANALKTRANAITITAEGTTIRADNCSNDPIQGLKLYGRSEQDTTTGKQLIINNGATTFSTAGITFTRRGTAVRVKGTATAEAYLVFDNQNEISVKETPLIASITGSSGVSMVVGYYTDLSTGEFINDICTVNNSASKTFTYPAEAVATRTFLAVHAGVTIDATVYPMIRLASIEDDTFEDYTGAMPSPNPDYPQEVLGVTDIEVAVYGKNLLEPKNNSNGGYTATLNPDGSITVTGSAASTNNIYLTIATPKAETPLRLHRDVTYHMWGESSNGLYIGVKTLDRLGNASYSTTSNWNTNNGTDFMDIAQVYLESTGHAIGDTKLCGTYRFQLEVGDTFTGFEPYKTPNTYVIPWNEDPLYGIPVETGGNYTDAYGQQWLCDEIDMTRGVHIQRIGHKYFTTSNLGSWDFESARTPANAGVFVTDISDFNINTNYPVLCNRYVYGTNADSLGNTRAFSIYENRTWEACGPLEKALAFNEGTIGNTIQDWYNKLSEWTSYGGLDITYALTTPIERELSPNDIESFNELRSNYPTTTVGFECMIDGAYYSIYGCNGSVVYKADTKAYVDNNRTTVTDDQIAAAIAAYLKANPIQPATISDVTLRADMWQGTASPYSQVVGIYGVTENSQVDLTPSIEQLAIFHNKDLAFVTENVDGVVTVYALGDKPTNDYTIQVTITEVYV